MINISKKISIIFLVIFAILSTAFALNVNAVEEYSGSYGDENNGVIWFEREEHVLGEYSNEYGGFIFTVLNEDMRGRLIIESICQHAYDQEGYIKLQELYDYYDLLCCQKGTKLPSENETYLKGSNGDRLPIAFPHLTNNDKGKEIYKDPVRKEEFASDTYTNLSLGFYVPEGEPRIATPKEAYILAEMVKELESAIFYYDFVEDDNGNKVRYEGSLEGAEKVYVGDEELYIVEKEYVVTLPDGDNVRVDAVSDGNGGVVYKYKEGSYQNHYEKYEGKLTWEDSKTGSGGTYPSFECENSSYRENSGEVTSDNVVPEGTPIYITGSNFVVKEGDEYYRATLEGNNSYIQLAWWTTIAGSLGNVVYDTPFSQEADAFEAYILQAAGVTSTSELEHYTATVTDEETGEEKEIENAFKIEYEPGWIVDGEYENPTTVFEEDKQSFVVGPFAIEYIDASAQYGGRPEVEFAGITNMEIYTDAQEEPLVYGEDWEFVYLDGERTEGENASNPSEGEEAEEQISFPKDSEKFYIRLFDTENATQITNIKVYFRYMNAAGSYQPLRGKYFKGTWKQNEKEFTKTVYDYDEETGEVIGSHQEYDYTQYWLKLTNVEEMPSQALAWGIKGAKWYEYIELERKVSINEGKVVIQKDVVDANGEEYDSEENDFFTFKVTVNGAINSGTDILRVRAGQAVESKVYYWMDEDGAPTYTVEEIEIPEGYEFVSMSNSQGNLKPSGRDTVIVNAINRIEENSGAIEIKKEFKESELGTINTEEYFDFRITLKGTFRFEGQNIEDSSYTTQRRIRSGETVRIDGITWYGEEAPKYSIEELDSPNSTLISITPESGTLIDDETVKVLAINEQDIEKGSIKIIKVLEGSAGLSREYIDSLTFKFRIYDVNGYEDEIVTLVTPTRQDENGNWVWEGRSSEYAWLKGNTLTYKIEEIEVPAGTEFVSGATEGTFVNNETSELEVGHVITNKITTANIGKIQITKKVDTEDLPVLGDKSYKFSVTVYGTDFKYTAPDGTVIECTSSEVLQLTNVSAVKIPAEGEYDINSAVVVGVGETWLSGEFAWYGDKAPEYKVEENLIGEDIASSVEPSEGLLSYNDTINVVAWNRDNTPNGGYLKIIKVLENADKYSTEYVNSLVFKFKIKVEGYDETIVALQPKKVDNTWVWEYTSDRYSWIGDTAPSYTIEEVDLPEGTEFVSAESTAPGATVSGTTISGQLINSSSPEDGIAIVTENKFINKVNEKQGSLIINKKVTHGSLNGKEFKFKVILKGSFEYNGVVYTDVEETLISPEGTEEFTVTGGSQYEIGPIKWHGNDAPEYTVIELESDIANNVSVVNGSGTISEGATATIATFTNEPKLVGGYFTIAKQLENGEGNQDKEFFFRVSVTGYEPYVVSVKPGEVYKSEMYKWYISEPAPEVTVEEAADLMPNGTQCIEFNGNQGQNSATLTLDYTDDQKIEFVAINKYESHSGKFNIKKVVLDEKLIDAAQEQLFQMVVMIDGYFGVRNDNGGMEYYDGHQFTIELKGGETYTSPEIIWWGDEVPSVTVREENLPLGWQNIGISNSGSPILEDETLEIVVTNKLPVYVVLDLTTKLAGKVWEDVPQSVDKNSEDSVENGICDVNSDGIQTEAAIPGVEVYIVKVVTDANGNPISGKEELATIYKDINNTEIEQPIITDATGRWEAPRVKIPTVSEEEKASGLRASYDVRFLYDGQTYEPTKFLATADGNVSEFLNASTADKDKFANDSMAGDSVRPGEIAEIGDRTRQTVNSKIATVEGNTPINGNGETTGKAIGVNGEENGLEYKSYDIVNNSDDSSSSSVEVNDSVVNGVTKIQSKLITKNENGIAYDLFKTEATTSSKGLTFPFYRDTESWNGFRLYNQNTSITELGVEQRYWYEAVYNYCLNINLGLKKRPEADLGLVKDLYEANVYVKGDSYSLDDVQHLRFNGINDLGADYYTRNISKDVNAEYTLGLYATDYYYRAEMYNEDSTLYDKLKDMDKTISANINSEMEVELKYKLYLYNESGSYLETVNTIYDYYDSSYEIKSVQTVDGASVPYSIGDKNIISSDGITYNQLIINPEVDLVSGEIKEYLVTFTVDKETIGGVHDTIVAGRKSNIAEIGSYSTKYSDGTIAGKIDRDSAPNNLNITNYNRYAWYEDDTDAAPVLYLEVMGENRSVIGQVWEDKKLDNQSIGDGVRQDNEALIAGLTTQLVEKVTVDGIDYDFIWPTHEQLNILGGRTLKDLTGFDSTIETTATSTQVEGQEAIPAGSYIFTGVPEGEYVVRFLYGNDKAMLDDTLNITGDAKAVDAEGNAFATYGENDEITLTANYDGNVVGTTPAVYNGQDYKATIYQAGLGHSITERVCDMSAEKISDARDSEARRLEVIANSETITNENSNVLSTANYFNKKNPDDGTLTKVDHTELYRDYYMFADSAVIELQAKPEIDDNEEDGFKEIIVNNVDCGLIERPETAMVLDKQISSIKLTTNDQRVIFNADYDIVYELENNPTDTVIAKVDNKYLVAKAVLSDRSVGTNVLQAINKFENKLPENTGTPGIQNFRFINIEDTIFQGATIEINYRLTALNVGETDYTSTTLEEEIINKSMENNVSEKVEILNLAKTLTNSASEYGKYLGEFYYTGNAGSNDRVVTTRVRQLVDYVDNDAVFSTEFNNSLDHMWKNTNISELAGYGYDSDRLIDRNVLPGYELLDKFGKAYITDQKNNIVLSVDFRQIVAADQPVGNSGFESKLAPYSYYTGNGSDHQEAINNSTRNIGLTVTKTVSAEDKDLTYDNLAEIVKIENSVGRRDMLSITGNANPKLGEFESSVTERDSSATELVTFTPPTGSDMEVNMTAQILVITLIALGIVAIGIVVIKKKVL